MINSKTSSIACMLCEDKFPVTINNVGFHLIFIQSLDIEKEKLKWSFRSHVCAYDNLS